VCETCACAGDHFLKAWRPELRSKHNAQFLDLAKKRWLKLCKDCTVDTKMTHKSELPYNGCRCPLEAPDVNNLETEWYCFECRVAAIKNIAPSLENELEARRDVSALGFEDDRITTISFGAHNCRCGKDLTPSEDILGSPAFVCVGCNGTKHRGMSYDMAMATNDQYGYLASIGALDDLKNVVWKEDADNNDLEVQE